MPSTLNVNVIGFAALTVTPAGAETSTTDLTSVLIDTLGFAAAFARAAPFVQPIKLLAMLATSFNCSFTTSTALFTVVSDTAVIDGAATSFPFTVAVAFVDST